jgi:hypothetical protein
VVVGDQRVHRGESDTMAGFSRNAR